MQLLKESIGISQNADLWQLFGDSSEDVIIQIPRLRQIFDVA